MSVSSWYRRRQCALAILDEEDRRRSFTVGHDSPPRYFISGKLVPGAINGSSDARGESLDQGNVAFLFYSTWNVDDERSRIDEV